MSSYDNWKTFNPEEDRPQEDDDGAPDEAGDEAWDDLIREDAPDEAGDEVREDRRREAEEDAADARQYGWGVSP